MSWKPKEQQLSAQQALQLAIEEAAPYWYQSSPMFWTVDLGEGSFVIQPLRQELNEGFWIVFGIHPLSFSTDFSWHLLRELRRRYESLGVRMILVLHQEYPFEREERWISRFLRKWQWDGPCVQDVGGRILRALFKGEVESSSSHYPWAAWLESNQIFSKVKNMTGIKSLEEDFRNRIWSSDPGVPFLQPYETESHLYREFERERSFHFGKNRSRASGISVKILGHWEQANDYASAEESDVALEVSLSGPSLGLIAQSLSKEQEEVLAVLEFLPPGKEGVGNYSPIPDKFRGKDFEIDPGGRSSVRILYPGFYEALTGLPENFRRIRITFPRSKHVPVRLTSLRFL